MSSREPFRPTKRDTDRYRAALHEAGHVVVAYHLGVVAISVEIGISEDTGRDNTKFPSEWNTRHTKTLSNPDHLLEPLRSTVQEWVEQHVMVALAGGHAEMAFTGCEPTETGTYLGEGTGSDVEMAWTHVDRFFTHDDVDAATLMGELEDRTRDLVVTLQDEITGVADALVKSRKLSEYDVRRLLGEG